MFKLTSIDPTRSVPSAGEDMGCDLRNAGDALLAQLTEGRPLDVYGAKRVAQLYRLAADAFDSACAASIGHNRRDRYEAASESLRAKADKLTAPR
jgi:hypothetical protein